MEVLPDLARSSAGFFANLNNIYYIYIICYNYFIIKMK